MLSDPGADPVFLSPSFDFCNFGDDDGIVIALVVESSILVRLVQCKQYTSLSASSVGDCIKSF